MHTRIILRLYFIEDIHAKDNRLLIEIGRNEHILWRQLPQDTIVRICVVKFEAETRVSRVSKVVLCQFKSVEVSLDDATSLAILHHIALRVLETAQIFV